nr:MAG TPA: HNH endonuclease bacteriophage, HNH Endonuclease, DNA.52A [Caudoviricetes sp.]
MMRSYSELLMLDTFEERFDYLNLQGKVGFETFGSNRYLNQAFYSSKEWKDVRNAVIVRDNACDLGIPDRQLFGRITIHHMNPIEVEDLNSGSSMVLDPEYLISVSHNTHNAIHYGDASLLTEDYSPRSPGDTLLWRSHA